MRSVFKTPRGTELPLLNLKGKEYLQVAHRLVWFREEHPKWSIKTEFIDLGPDFAFAKASIFDLKGTCLAMSHKYEDKKGFFDFREKAETGAIGRCLALLGYGTQFAADELDEGSRIVDSPTPPPKSSVHKSVNNYAKEPAFDPSEPKEFTEARRRREEAEREADRLLNQKLSSPPDIDTALASDPMPNYESAAEPVTLLDRLVQLAEQKNIPHAEMASIIRRVTGAPRKAKDLSQAELNKVVQFVEKFVSQKTE